MPRRCVSIGIPLLRLEMHPANDTVGDKLRQHGVFPISRHIVQLSEKRIASQLLDDLCDIPLRTTTLEVDVDLLEITTADNCDRGIAQLVVLSWCQIIAANEILFFHSSLPNVSSPVLPW